MVDDSLPTRSQRYSHPSQRMGLVQGFQPQRSDLNCMLETVPEESGIIQNWGKPIWFSYPSFLSKTTGEWIGSIVCCINNQVILRHQNTNEDYAVCTAWASSISFKLCRSAS